MARKKEKRPASVGSDPARTAGAKRKKRRTKSAGSANDSAPPGGGPSVSTDPYATLPPEDKLEALKARAEDLLQLELAAREQATDGDGELAAMRTGNGGTPPSTGDMLTQYKKVQEETEVFRLSRRKHTQKLQTVRDQISRCEILISRGKSGIKEEETPPGAGGTSGTIRSSRQEKVIAQTKLEHGSFAIRRGGRPDYSVNAGSICWNRFLHAISDPDHPPTLQDLEMIRSHCDLVLLGPARAGRLRSQQYGVLFDFGDGQSADTYASVVQTGGKGDSRPPKGKGKGGKLGKTKSEGLGPASKRKKVKRDSPLSTLPPNFDKLSFPDAKKWLDEHDSTNKAPATVLALVKKRLRAFSEVIRDHWSFCDYCMEETKGPGLKDARKEVNDDSGYSLTAKVISETKRLAEKLAQHESVHSICACPAEDWGTRVGGQLAADLQKLTKKMPEVSVADIELTNGTTLSWTDCQTRLTPK